MKLIKYSLDEKELFEVFLPNLKGKVFHFTYSKNWSSIQKEKKILSNTNGKYGYGSAHSQKSMGSYLGAICLFDLRDVDEVFIDEDSIFHDYFNRRVTSESPSFFIILDKKVYSKILCLDNTDNDLIEEKMYIPDIESWYLGDLDLTDIETVYEVSLKK